MGHAACPQLRIAGLKLKKSLIKWTFVIPDEA